MRWPRNEKFINYLFDPMICLRQNQIRCICVILTRDEDLDHTCVRDVDLLAPELEPVVQAGHFSSA